jgi:hypothetical protein
MYVERILETLAEKGFCFKLSKCNFYKKNYIPRLYYYTKEN